MVKLVGSKVVFLFLQNNLNPVMIPFLESTGGNCQRAVILVEEFAAKVKLIGALEGTAIWKGEVT